MGTTILCLGLTAAPAWAAAPVSISMSLGAATVPLNGSTSLRFTIVNTNPRNGATVTGIGFADTLPSGLVVATPNGLQDDCGGATADPGSSSISLTGLTLVADSVCTVTVTVSGSATGVKNNMVGVNSSAGSGNTAFSQLTVAGPPHTFSVPCSSDPGSLIEAFTAANANAGPDVVQLAPGCTYTLSGVDNRWYGPNGLPAIATNITIEGNGATIARDPVGPSFRIFFVGADPNAPNTQNYVSPGPGALTLRNLTVSDGLARGGDSQGGGAGAGMGGAIFNQGTVVIDHSTLTANAAEGGSAGDPSADGGGGGIGASSSTSGAAGGFDAFSGSSNTVFASAGGGNGGIGADGGAAGGGAGFQAGESGLSASSPTTSGGGGGPLSGLGGQGGSGVGGAGAPGGDGGGGGGGSAGYPTGHAIYGGGQGAFGSGATSGYSGGGGGIGGGGGPSLDQGGGGGGGFGGGGGEGDLASGGDGGFGGGAGAAKPGLAGTPGFGGGSAGSHSGGGGAGMGGAIFNMQGELTIRDSTLAGNAASGGAGGGAGQGIAGAVFNLNGALTAIDSTLANNRAANDASQIFNFEYDAHNVRPAQATLVDTIVANGAGGAAYDLASDKSTSISQPPASTANADVSRSDLVRSMNSQDAGTITGFPLIVDPGLGGLAFNGGPTQTMAPLAGSPVIDAGGTGADCLGSDQRGDPRPDVGETTCDIGAVEYQDAATGGGNGGGGTGGKNGGGGGGSGAQIAAVGHESILPAVFAAAPRGPSALVARKRFGTQVTYTLNVAALVRFTVTTSAPGRRARGGRCVKATKASRHRRRCTRLVTLPGAFTLSARTGINGFRFTGRLGGRKLRPGAYQLVATPIVAGKPGHAGVAAFRIVK